MPTLPESHHIRIQGNLGTGKTFVIKIMRNITKNVLKCNHYDEATAPTGVAASLIDDKTHFRGLRIPVSGKKFYNPTTNIIITNAEANKLCHDIWRNIFLFIMDEDSMAGRPFWAWFRHIIDAYTII